ncbi:MAG: metallophosphoesterase [Chitinivibrionales bacterium]|nr:metallophosphoesterase [Chitinivibrionales bacterium]
MNYNSALIHLSDIECGVNNRGELPSYTNGYQRCADKLIADIETELSRIQLFESQRIGLIITGDTANFGTAREYEKATLLIERVRTALKITPRHTAIIPGNHDVCWDECRAAIQKRFPDKTGYTDDMRDEVRIAPEKLIHFRQFFENLCGAPYCASEGMQPFPGFDELGIVLAGFDTTYPCTFCEEDNFGLLRNASPLNFGGEMLDAHFSSNPLLLPVALLHHCPMPLQNLTDGSKSYLHNAEEALQYLESQGFKVVLCGHEHQVRASSDLRRGNQIFVTGSFGLNAEKLRFKYYKSTKNESNKYQILLVNNTADSQVLLRTLEQPGVPDSRWVDDGKDSRFSVYLHRPNPSHINVRYPGRTFTPFLASPKRMHKGDYVFAACIVASTDDLAAVQEVRYTLEP